MNQASERLPRTVTELCRGISAQQQIGAQLYVSRRGEIVADVGLGEARRGEPMTSEHLNLWMSSVKPVTGVAIGQLWERGLLDPDDEVRRFIPEFAAGGKQAITLRHLLTHTAGFRFAAPEWTTPLGWNEILEQVCKAELEPGWLPGAHAGYHVASAWYVLAELVRRLDGRSYERYVREAIFEPLAMRDSWLGMPEPQHRAYGTRIAPMHDASHGEPVPHPLWPFAGSARGCAICRPGGSAWGPMHDLGRFYEALLAGGAAAHGRVLRPQTVAALTARDSVGLLDRSFGFVLDRGLGFVIDSRRYGGDADWFGPHCSPRTFGHAGFQSSVGFADPAAGLVVAIVLNGMIEQQQHWQRMRRILDALYRDLELAEAGAT